MKVGIMRFMVMAAIAAVAVVVGSSAAWAQTCPTSPNYTPDFSSNQTCVTLNGTTTGYPGFYTAVSGSGTVLRLTPNSTDTAGSAWFNAQQPVGTGTFSTTFTFQLTGANTSWGPADGITFVIQNSPPPGTNALGPDGCGIGFGDDTLIGCTSSTGGIPNSLVVEFNTFLNQGIDPNNNDVTIQNCSGTLPNSVDPSCSIAVNSNLPSTMTDGNVHSVTINYSGPATKLLDVTLDNVDLFPGGVFFDLTTLGLNSGSAWVGFTASTGGGDDNQDILSWTFIPQAQTAVISTTQTAILNFPNAAGTNVYDANALLTQTYPTPVIQVQPILISQAACDALVQKNFWPARCFVYANAENSGLNSSVLFQVTCPTSPGGTCGSAAEQDFFAELGTDFQYQQSENPFFVYPGIFGPLNPFPGWLKGGSGLTPCTPTGGPLFQSNQIDTFFIDTATTRGKSGGGGSCWVATYDTPGEQTPGIKISTPTFTTYTLNQVVTANYACSNPTTSKPATSPTGPYLTVATCTQSELPPAKNNTNSCNFQNGQLVCTGPVDTSTLGFHTFIVTSDDSGGNQNIDAVIYKVVK
ncbi:MAG TPA: L-type lectin-domain containing protein [Terriglobales bacterium]|nr:L-type lectin-domain containing protein [Terriglobales bacterium]